MYGVITMAGGDGMLCTISHSNVVLGTHCSSGPWQCVSSLCLCLAHRYQSVWVFFLYTDVGGDPSR